MDFIHLRKYIRNDEVVVVDCDMQSNVMLTDDSNFKKFKGGSRYTYYGGFYTHFPVSIQPPSGDYGSSGGYWNITIDLGLGYTGEYHYQIDVDSIDASGNYEGNSSRADRHDDG